MKKVYEKPYLEVVEYVGDYGYATSTTSDCYYLTCLIGAQSSENIVGLTIYTFTYDGTTYYVWYYDYSNGTGANTTYTFSSNVTSFNSNFSKGTVEWYQGLMKSACSSISDTDFQSGLWHIATDADGEYNKS